MRGSLRNEPLLNEYYVGIPSNVCGSVRKGRGSCALITPVTHCSHDRVELGVECSLRFTAKRMNAERFYSKCTPSSVRTEIEKPQDGTVARHLQADAACQAALSPGRPRGAAPRHPPRSRASNVRYLPVRYSVRNFYDRLCPFDQPVFLLFKSFSRHLAEYNPPNREPQLEHENQARPPLTPNPHSAAYCTIRGIKRTRH